MTSNDDGLPGPEWTTVTKLPVEVKARRVEERREIDTREGTVVAEPGDVLMRGVEGELYPCDPEIFRKTYRLGSAGEEKTVQEVYEDRNAAVLGLARMANYLKAERPGREIRSCWQPDEGDDADADEWAIIYVWLRDGRQVSWHVPRSRVEGTRIPKKHAEWDGHTREEKNQRLREFAAPNLL